MGSIMQQVERLRHYVSSSVDGLFWSNNASMKWNHSEQVHVEAFTGSTKVEVGDNNTKCTPVLVQVTAAPQQPQIPLDVVAVLDVSSNMNGSTDRMKEAMEAVIKTLRPNDRLSLVFLEDVPSVEMNHTLMNRKGCDDAKKTIQSMISKTKFRKYGDNLGTEALDTVLGQMKSMAEEQQDRMRCVMLLSCGEDKLNMAQWITKITEHKFQFCSFDVGAQHAAAAAGRFKCVAAAGAGAGAYHYIVDDESSSSTSSVTDAFESFVRGLHSVVATSVKLSLEAVQAAGFTISSVEAGGHSASSSNNNKHEVHIAGIHAGEKKSFIVYLEKEEEEEKEEKEHILCISGKFQLVSSSSTETVLQRCLLPGKDVARAMTSDVAAEVVRSRLVTEMNEIIITKEEATEVARTEKQIMEDVEAAWKNIELSDMYEVAKSTELVKHIQEDVGLMKVKGHSYMMSWLSCHWWQRATTMSRYSFAFEARSTAATTPGMDQRWRQLGAAGVVILVLLLLLLLRWWWRPLLLPPSLGTGLDLVKYHPEWPAMKEGLDNLVQVAEDSRITSFFTERQATALEMNQQIDQYIYMAILHAAVIRGHYEGSTNVGGGLVITDKVLRSHAETYLQTMLTRAKRGVLPSLEATSLEHMTQSMSEYLYSTIVQAKVLVTIIRGAPAPVPVVPAPPAPDAQAEIIDKLKSKISELEKENKDLQDEINKLKQEKKLCCEKAEDCENKNKVNAN